MQIFADWDADGVVSAALIYYAQRYRGKFPLPGEKADIGLWPGGPRSTLRNIEELLERVRRTRREPRVAVFLDIPLTPQMLEALKTLQRELTNIRIVYIDHHYSTLANAKKLYEVVEEAYLGHRPTAVLVYNLLRSLGVRHVTPRLEAFMRAVGVLERDKVAGQVEDRIVKLAASLSKATAVTRDAELWRRLVVWLASPLPSPAPVDQNLIERVVKIAQESDREIEEKAKLLAPSARRVGFLKVIDVRGRWEGRGVSALASKLYKIVRGPVAVIANAGEHSIIVIRAPGKLAYRMALLLVKKGLGDNIGGHGSLAIVRLKPEVETNKLLEELRRISFEAQRSTRRR
ncbi:phosphoesterase [Pyrolobus fumarii]|uniref:phosphoesterase n=1 Tax=Pyrolobus fumarii TaxID=54252 RepID=UPI001FCA509F|nr:phosphoesterase [Pyrolobus fumarii]